MLFNILKAIEEATGVKPVPFATNVIDGSIVYNYRVFSDDGAMAQSLLEIRIIGKSMGQIEDLNLKVKRAILRFGDGSNVSGVSAAFVNGESYLPMDDIIQKITNFNIKHRSEV